MTELTATASLPGPSRCSARDQWWLRPREARRMFWWIWFKETWGWVVWEFCLPTCFPRFLGGYSEKICVELLWYLFVGAEAEDYFMDNYMGWLQTWLPEGRRNRGDFPKWFKQAGDNSLPRYPKLVETWDREVPIAIRKKHCARELQPWFFCSVELPIMFM